MTLKAFARGSFDAENPLRISDLMVQGKIETKISY